MCVPDASSVHPMNQESLRRTPDWSQPGWVHNPVHNPQAVDRPDQPHVRDDCLMQKYNRGIRGILKDKHIGLALVGPGTTMLGERLSGTCFGLVSNIYQEKN